MLKKFVGISMSLLLSAGFATSAFAAEPTAPDNTAAIYTLIDKTNHDIEGKIAKAMKDSDNLQSQYLQDIQKIEEGDAVVNLKAQKSKLESDLQNTTDANKASQISKTLDEVNAKINVETAKVQDNLKAIQTEIAYITAQLETGNQDQNKLSDQLNKLQNQINQKESQCSDRTNKFTHDLDKLIRDLNDVTLKISSETINKAAAQGVQAETYWTEVELGGKLVWIDPIRVCH